jgi:creatinine amidohydrolase
MPIYLKEFAELSKKGVAYLPIGTIEWHGSHLPVETDFLVAEKICKIISKKIPGYVLPPIYLGTDRAKIVGGKRLAGMDKYLGKILPGSLYYLEPALFFRLIVSLAKNLKIQGFKKVFVITGHGGSKHIETLEKVVKKNPILHLINPYKDLTVHAHHADEYELSLFLACYPEEEKNIRKIKIGKNDDFFQYKGYDPRKKASLKIGNKILKEIINNCLKKIR